MDVDKELQAPRYKAFVEALKVSLPLMLGYMFLSVSLGIYMTGRGFSPWWPVCMAATIYAGSMEFLAVELLLGMFNPIYALILTFAVNGRHIFYGISLIDRYQHTGWKLFPLVSGLTDEAFSVIYVSRTPKGVDSEWYMFFITSLLYLSWILGASIGAFVGSCGLADIKGVEFVMPALFIVIFISQWQKEKSHASSIIGLVVSAMCLPVFGERYFLLPALMIVALGYCASWAWGREREEADL